MTNGERNFDVVGQTVIEALQNFVAMYPNLRQHLFTDGGAVRHNILCVLGEDYVRNTEVSQKKVRAGDTIRIINSIAGGV